MSGIPLLIAYHFTPLSAPSNVWETHSPSRPSSCIEGDTSRPYSLSYSVYPGWDVCGLLYVLEYSMAVAPRRASVYLVAIS